MAYKISDDCICCGTCAGECPVNAIKEGDGKYEIDADACIGCGACENLCPSRPMPGMVVEGHAVHRVERPVPSKEVAYEKAHPGAFRVMEQV